MGTDELFKKRRKERKQRRYEYRMPRANSYLIATEGTRTEPLYFEGIKKEILKKIGGRVDVVSVPLIQIEGEGSSTGRLIETADEIVKKANIWYQNVWIVFDRDDFRDFDWAIAEGKRRGYHIAWSNPSFEYWLYLHFAYSDSALHRDDWNQKLDVLFKEYSLGEGKYKKNYTDIYDLVDTYGGVDTAVKNAKRRMADFDEGNCKPSAFDPGTTVFELVEELKKMLEY